jgi:hypothetical protein
LSIGDAPRSRARAENSAVTAWCRIVGCGNGKVGRSRVWHWQGDVGHGVGSVGFCNVMAKWSVVMHGRGEAAYSWGIAGCSTVRAKWSGVWLRYRVAAQGKVRLRQGAARCCHGGVSLGQSFALLRQSEV